jgi:hypothetical protein
MAGSMARTEQGDVHFTVKEFADGSPWIMVDPEYKTMPALHDAFIGFQLNHRTTLQQAQRIADFLNNNLAGVSLTIFETHPLFNKPYH